MMDINMEELIYAMETHVPGTEFYLDLKTNKILIKSDYAEDVDNLEEKLEKEPKRFVYIEPVPSQIAYSYMVEFIDTVTDELLKVQSF